MSKWQNDVILNEWQNDVKFDGWQIIVNTKNEIQF